MGRERGKVQIRKIPEKIGKVPEITLPPLQTHFAIFFAYLAGDLALKNGGDFW